MNFPTWNSLAKLFLFASIWSENIHVNFNFHVKFTWRYFVSYMRLQLGRCVWLRLDQFHCNHGNIAPKPRRCYGLVPWYGTWDTWLQWTCYGFQMLFLFNFNQWKFKSCIDQPGCRKLHSLFGMFYKGLCLAQIDVILLSIMQIVILIQILH